MSEIDNALKDFLRTTRSMESNIISIIFDSNRDIEMILKELLVYLDATSKNLEKVQSSLVDFVSEYKSDKDDNSINDELGNIINTIKVYHSKLVEAETSNTKKILELTRQVGIVNQKSLKQILAIVSKITNSLEDYDGKLDTTTTDLQEIKSLLRVITNEVTDTKTNVVKNQDNLMSVIGNMMDANTKKLLTTGEVETQKIKSTEEIFKTKTALIGKIVGILLGSSGVIYLLIDVLIKAAQ